MKWYVYILCVILIGVGIFFGIKFYREAKAESYINGSIDISNKFSSENFSYSASSVVFYHDPYDYTDTYSFEQELLKVENFDGQEKVYQVWLNKFLLLHTEFNAGSINSEFIMHFYDEYRNDVCTAILKISIKYLSDKTVLNLSTVGQAPAKFLEQYFGSNGIKLNVKEILQNEEV